MLCSDLDDYRDWMKIQVHKSESCMWRLWFLFPKHVSWCFHLPNIFSVLSYAKYILKDDIHFPQVICPLQLYYHQLLCPSGNVLILFVYEV
jgi:hypothetical protein